MGASEGTGGDREQPGEMVEGLPPHCVFGGWAGISLQKASFPFASDQPMESIWWFHVPQAGAIPDKGSAPEA